MDSNSNYKNRALDSLDGKWDKAALVTFVYFLLYEATTAPSLFLDFSGSNYDRHWTFGWSLILFLAILPLFWGLVIYCLYIVRNEYLGMERLFDGYRAFKRIMLTKLLVAVYTFLWALLLIIPGIVKFYSYSMTDYILRDDPMLEYDAAIRRSMEMMEGHKMDLFGLHLSFIGWFFLSLLTCGLGFILLIPYFLTAQAHFYEDLKAEYEQRTTVQ